MQISLYGFLIMSGFLAAYGVSFILARKTGTIDGSHLDRMLVWVFIPAVIGARAFFVLYHLDYFFQHPLEIPAVWHGGWVWHGALLGGMLGAYAYCKRAGIAFLSLLDILAPGVALGQAIGRWGNYVNQEAYGLPTDLPWAIAIDPERRLAGYESFATFHPTFLYESIVDFLLFLFLGRLLWKRLDPGLRRDDKGRGNEKGERRGPSALPRDDKRGVIFFLYLFLYSLVRFLIEFLRIDAVPVFLGLRVPQWISFILIVVSITGLAGVLRKQKKVVY